MTLLMLAALAALALLILRPMGVHTDAAQPSKGATLAYSTTQAGTYTPVSLVTSIEGPEPEKEKVDITVLTSTFMQYRDSAVPDLGELTFNIWHDPGSTVHATLEGWATGASPTMWWHLVFADVKQTTVEFQGFLTKFAKGSNEIKSNLNGSVSICLTSVPTYTYGNPTG